MNPSYVVISILLLMNIVSVVLYFVFKHQLKVCERNESFNCPSITCKNYFSVCGNRPYYCKGGGECGEGSPNLVCQEFGKLYY